MHPKFLNLHRVCKSYVQGNHRVEVLENLNLSVDEGEAVAVLGPSGSGKSTLLSLIAGMEKPDVGTVEIEGRDLAKLSEDERSRLRSKKIGIIFQQYHLMRNLTAVENVALPLEIQNRSDYAQVARKAIKQVGLSHRLAHFPSEMSGGERQRIAIARAMATDPSLILADEPSGNLDETTGNEVMDLLFRLQESSNLALLLVTHNLALAERCDRILHLKNGKLIERKG